MKKYLLMISLWSAIVFLQESLFADEGLYIITTIKGEKDGDNFCKVVNADDVNGDGFNDILVGAIGGNYAKLYFGGSPFDTVPDLIFKVNEYYSFGETVAGGGDLNSDGFDDILIGWPHYGDFEPGRVQVYFGGHQMDNTPDLILEEFGYYYTFGHSLAIAGDVNNDGFDDIVVGAPNDDYDARGRAFIYFGGNPMDNKYDVYLEGQDDADQFGSSVSGAGDVNKDGNDDIIIGAPQALHDTPGKAYLFYGGKEIGFNNHELFNNNIAWDQYGRVVADFGDINNDGFSDLGIMSLSKTDIFFGDTNFNTILDLTLLPGSNENFGFINGLGDLNKDNYDDFTAVSRKVKIYFGSANIDTVPDISLTFWATPVCGLKDINKDDLIEVGFGIGGGWDPKGHVDIYSYGPINSISKNENSNFNKSYILNNNFPNPFNSNTTLIYKLSTPCQISMEIFNSCGQSVRKLLSAYNSLGTYHIKWDGKDDNNITVNSGVYYLVMKVKQNGGEDQIQQEIKKLVFLK